MKGGCVVLPCCRRRRHVRRIRNDRRTFPRKCALKDYITWLLDECRPQQPIPLFEPVSQVLTASRRRMNERTDAPKWPPSKTLSHLPPKLLELHRVSWILLREMRGRTGAANSRSCWPQSATLSDSATLGDFHIWLRRTAVVRHSTSSVSIPRKCSRPSGRPEHVNEPAHDLVIDVCEMVRITKLRPNLKRFVRNPVCIVMTCTLQVHKHVTKVCVVGLGAFLIPYAIMVSWKFELMLPPADEE